MNTHLGSKLMFLTISSGNMCRVNQCQDKSSAASLSSAGSKPIHNFFLKLKVASLHFSLVYLFDLSSLVGSISIPVYNTRVVTKSWNYIYTGADLQLKCLMHNAHSINFLPRCWKSFHVLLMTVQLMQCLGNVKYLHLHDITLTMLRTFISNRFPSRSRVETQLSARSSSGMEFSERQLFWSRRICMHLCDPKVM